MRGSVLNYIVLSVYRIVYRRNVTSELGNNMPLSDHNGVRVDARADSQNATFHFISSEQIKFSSVTDKKI